MVIVLDKMLSFHDLCPLALSQHNVKTTSWVLLYLRSKCFLCE